MCNAAAQRFARPPRSRNHRALPAIHSTESQDYRDAEADQDGDPLDVSILPANELVFLQVGYVVVWLISFQLENQPSDMRVKKPFRNTVRIIVMIHMLMMTPMSLAHIKTEFSKAAAPKISVNSPIGQLAWKVMCEKSR